ncbi:MAG: hypothetical protein BGO39_09460 [Chloroflexi bacterium 54-19]|nr:MAG: hypothetical protein BGO39_09460 [Chloroflexi bacterium 54-19]
MRLALTDEPDILDPARTVNGAANSINNLLYERLVYIDKDGLPKPWLASSWEISPDSCTISFTLRPNLKFQDSTPLNAVAVKTNFDRILDPKAASPTRNFFGSLQSVSTNGETQVIFNFKTPFASIFTNLSLAYGGIVSPTALAKYGDQFGRHPVGSGPFIFKEWKTGQEIDLIRNSNYHSYREDLENKGTAFLEEVDFLIIPAPATQIAALERGQLDMVTPLQTENVQQVRGDSRFKLVELHNSSNLVLLDFSDKPPFNSLEFRQALSYAVDRKQIVKNGVEGFASANQSPLPNGLAGWEGTLSGYGFDPEKARGILKNAGWKLNSKGVLEKDGVAASFKLLSLAGSSSIKRTSEIIQANLKEVGIEITIQNLELSAGIPLLAKGNFDMAIFSLGWPDPSFLSLLYKSNSSLVKRGGDSELDSLLDKVDTTLDIAARLDYVREAQKLIIEKAKVVPLYSPWTLIAFQNRVQDTKLDGLALPLYNDVWFKD